MTTPAPPKGLLAAQAARTAEFVGYQAGAVVSREIVRKPAGNVTLFAFDEGEGLSEHTAPFDALVQVLEGEVEIMISGHAHRLQGGMMILLPAGQAHALKAVTRFKMMLTMIRAQTGFTLPDRFPAG
jgi:quercetin dioxygenase-like cupin family protein